MHQGAHIPARRFKGVMTDSFAKRLRAARIAKNFKTMREFAHALGINENTYARYERGQSHPSPATLDRICRSLGVTPDDLDPIAPNATKLPRPASGFADNPSDGLASSVDFNAAEASSAGRLRLSARIWRLATVLTRARGFRSADVKAIAAIFQNLYEDPIAKAAIIVSTIEDAVWKPKLKAELQAAITAIVQHFDDEAGQLRD